MNDFHFAAVFIVIAIMYIAAAASLLLMLLLVVFLYGTVAVAIVIVVDAPLMTLVYHGLCWCGHTIGITINIVYVVMCFFVLLCLCHY